MRIVFIGAVDFSAHSLHEILKGGGHVAAIFTIAPSRANFHSDFADLSDIAHPHNIPLHYVRNINHSRNLERIKSYKPDVIFVFGWSQLIKRPILDIPPRGCIGTHPALLPQNRGRHPIVWALVEGLKQTGLTFFYLDEGADSGDILWQKPCRIDLVDDASTLYEKIKGLASEGIAEFLPLLQNNRAPRCPQDHSKATYWRKRAEKDGEIDWTLTSETTYNLIRALTRPYVGAHTYHKNAIVKIWGAQLPSEPLSQQAQQHSPGTVTQVTPEGNLWVRTSDGALLILHYEHTGNAPIVIGDKLETSA